MFEVSQIDHQLVATICVKPAQSTHECMAIILLMVWLWCLRLSPHLPYRIQEKFCILLYLLHNFFPPRKYFGKTVLVIQLFKTVFADNSIFYLFFSLNKKVQTVHRKITGLESGRSRKQASKVKVSINGPIFTPWIIPGVKENAQEETLKCCIQYTISQRINVITGWGPLESAHHHKGQIWLQAYKSVSRLCL